MHRTQTHTCDDSICGCNRRNDVLDDTLSQAIRDTLDLILTCSLLGLHACMHYSTTKNMLVQSIQTDFVANPLDVLRIVAVELVCAFIQVSMQLQTCNARVRVME